MPPLPTSSVDNPIVFCSGRSKQEGNSLLNEIKRSVMFELRPLVASTEKWKQPGEDNKFEKTYLTWDVQTWIALVSISRTGLGCRGSQTAIAKSQAAKVKSISLTARALWWNGDFSSSASSRAGWRSSRDKSAAREAKSIKILILCSIVECDSIQAWHTLFQNQKPGRFTNKHWLFNAFALEKWRNCILIKSIDFTFVWFEIQIASILVAFMSWKIDSLAFPEEIFIRFRIERSRKTEELMHTLLDYFPECDLEMGQMHQDVSKVFIFRRWLIKQSMTHARRLPTRCISEVWVEAAFITPLIHLRVVRACTPKPRAIATGCEKNKSKSYRRNKSGRE